MFHKVACFHFDGIANHSDVIYVCFELEMSLGWDIGGGPTLLGAAKPYGEFICCIPFLSVQQIGSRITLLWGCSMLVFWLPNILLLQRWNKIDIKTLHITFPSSSVYREVPAHLMSLQTYTFQLSTWRLFSFDAHHYLSLNFFFFLLRWETTVCALTTWHSLSSVYLTSCEASKEQQTDYEVNSLS